MHDRVLDEGTGGARLNLKAIPPTVVRYRTRFVIVTDYAELPAVDTKTGENLMIPIRDIDKHSLRREASMPPATDSGSPP